MQIFFLIFALFFSLSAEDVFDENDTPVVSQHILYSYYDYVPKRIFKGQIFPITIKTLSTEKNFEEISYEFYNGSGVRLLNEKPVTKEKDHYFYHTFYFASTSKNVKTPDITISLVYSKYIKDELVFLKGKRLKVVSLNPPKDFANIIANNFYMTQYKTNQYSDRENISVFSLEADFSVITDFHLGDYVQGIESNTSDIKHSSMTYYVIIPKGLEQLEFSYFHLPSKKFKKIIMPIILDDDSVSTQSNLTPKDHRHTQIKLYIAITVAFISLILFILRKRYFYLIIVVLAAVYALYVSIPIQNACVKKGSSIYLLPMSNGTVFEVTSKKKIFEIEGSIDGYIKVKLHNNKIGWIKNENLCSN
jgi:hypothetical protein